MTLCITYKQGESDAISISDSLLTTIARKKSETNQDETNEAGAFLPSNVEVVHQTPHAVKVHIVSQKEHFYSGSNYDFICAIAGNVSLGLQCLLHLESYLQGTYDLWFDDMVNVIHDKVYPFWDLARDKEIELSFAISDHKRKAHIYEVKSDGTKLYIDEIKDHNGVLISVIGDGAASVKSDIMRNVNNLMMQTSMSLDEALHQCCIDALNEKVNDDDAVYIGGSIQGAHLSCYKATYLAFRSDEVYFRGAWVESADKLDFPYIDLNSVGYAINESGW